jgi:PHP family Zn ribbon phosphoesterase
MNCNKCNKQLTDKEIKNRNKNCSKCRRRVQVKNGVKYGEIIADRCKEVSDESLFRARKKLRELRSKGKTQAPLSKKKYPNVNVSLSYVRTFIMEELKERELI